MTIEELSQAMHDFVLTQGCYPPNSPRPHTPRNLAISLSLEASEVLEHFQWNGDIKDRVALADELADVALYLFQISSICEIDLEETILKKLERNYGRKWDSNQEISK